MGRMARGSITKAKNLGLSTQQLQKALLCGPAHVLGDHSQCLDELCKRSDEDYPVINRWEKFPALLKSRIKHSLSYLVKKASHLIHDQTSNLCEMHMGLVAEFVGGKVFNRAPGGSYQRRCYGAGLRYQLG